MQKEVTSTLKNLVWIILILLVGVVLVKMIEKKQTTKTIAVAINISHLPDGNDLLTRGDVFEMLDRSFGSSMEGIPQNLVDVERIEKVLKENPFVLDAEAYIGAKELSYYFDKDGNKMPTSKHFTARVLTATGNIPPHTPEFID